MLMRDDEIQCKPQTASILASNGGLLLATISGDKTWLTLHRRGIDFKENNDQHVTARERIQRAAGSRRCCGKISRDRKHIDARLSDEPIDLLFDLADLCIHTLEDLDLLHDTIPGFLDALGLFCPIVQPIDDQRELATC